MSSGDTKHGRNTKFAEEKDKLSSTRMNIVIFMSLLIDLLGFTVILPLMPKLLEFYGDKGSVSSSCFFCAICVMILVIWSMRSDLPPSFVLTVDAFSVKITRD